MAKLKNDYLNIPVLFKGHIYEGFNLFAGPQLGIQKLYKLKTTKTESGFKSGFGF